MKSVEDTLEEMHSYFKRLRVEAGELPWIWPDKVNPVWEQYKTPDGKLTECLKHFRTDDGTPVPDEVMELLGWERTDTGWKLNANNGREK